MKHAKSILLAALLAGVFLGCSRGEEYTAEEAASLKAGTREGILAKTVGKPGGVEEFKAGRVGGTWTATLTNDPKTFNTLTARDADSRTVIDPPGLYDYLADYDPYKREWKPQLASFEIQTDEAKDTLAITFTLRDDLYWTTPGQTREQGAKVTSDDVVFWYNEIDGDKSLQLPEYSGQFIEMPDGSMAHIDIEKIGERRFAFRYPRIVANPILSTNMMFGPRHIFQPAKQNGGVEALLNLYSVDTDVKTIPSIGQYHLVEYSPGVRVVARRNPNYWRKDPQGTSYPYVEEVIYRIVPDVNTEFLLFKQGTKDSYTVRPEDLDDLLNQQNPDYTVYNGGESLDSAFITFNQNPNTMTPTVYGWFSQTKFRQAMSAMLNRGRIAEQVYRGLAVPALHFFAKPNPYYDEDIRQQFTYDPERAVELLSEIGIKKNSQGVMVDAQGNPIEFEFSVGAENNIGVDVANIFADELKGIGINAKVRPIDFQKLVEMLTKTYDWQVVLVRLGANYWPSGGINVWLSSGNFHLWYPLQENPATEWEARVDYLYNEGRFTVDEQKAKEIYDEYQRILLDQVPLMYIVHPLSFLAVRDRWDNVYYDTLNGLDSTYVFLKDR
jgi:peptide/nickel transport system substrate-binding protein